MDKSKWESGLPSEVEFWAEVADGARAEYHENLRRRATGDCPFPSELKPFIPVSGKMRVLDVGAGPQTVVGRSDGPKELEVVAIDPLASHYTEMLARNGIEPLVPTLYGEAEKVDEYGLGLFDITFSRNALDHCYDPLAAIKAMLATIKPTGAVVFVGYVNEGVNENYNGLHQWNFMPTEHGDVIVWNRSRVVLLSNHLGDAWRVAATNNNGWYKVVITKAPKRGWLRPFS